jgi:hypothetical protein
VARWGVKKEVSELGIRERRNKEVREGVNMGVIE